MFSRTPYVRAATQTTIRVSESPDLGLYPVAGFGSQIKTEFRSLKAANKKEKLPVLGFLSIDDPGMIGVRKDFTKPTRHRSSIGRRRYITAPRNNRTKLAAKARKTHANG